MWLQKSILWDRHKMYSFWRQIIHFHFLRTTINYMITIGRANISSAVNWVSIIQSFVCMSHRISCLWTRVLSLADSTCTRCHTCDVSDQLNNALTMAIIQALFACLSRNNIIMLVCFASRIPPNTNGSGKHVVKISLLFKMNHFRSLFALYSLVASSTCIYKILFKLERKLNSAV